MEHLLKKNNNTKFVTCSPYKLVMGYEYSIKWDREKSNYKKRKNK